MSLNVYIDTNGQHICTGMSLNVYIDRNDQQICTGMSLNVYIQMVNTSVQVCL